MDSSSETASTSSAPTSVRPAPPVANVPAILMVDDHPARLLTYEAILSGMPVSCVRAHSGEEALQLLLKQSFAVILLDVNMPGIDGFEVARYVRAHPRLGNTPIILVSGERLSDLDRLKGYEVGAIDYIGVPIVPEILRSKVAVLTELFHRRAELERLNQATLGARLAHPASDSAASTTQLRALFEQTSDVMVVMRGETDSTGELNVWRYVDANESALKVYKRTRDEIVGRTVQEVFPHWAERANTLCRQALLGKQRLQHEVEFASRQMLVRMFAVDHQCVAIVCTDITDRKLIEQALANSEKRFQALLEGCPVGVAQNGLDGRFEYVNTGFCNIVGYSAEELLGMTWQQITHPDDVLADQRRGEMVLAGKLPHYTLEKRYIRKDGTPVWVSMFGNFIFDDARRPVQGVAVVVDISARRVADMALHESRQRLVLAHEAAGLGSFDWNVRTDTATWDSRARELWGLPVHAPVNRTAALAGMHVDDRAAAAADIDRAMKPDSGGQYVSTYRVVNVADGKTRWVEAHGQVYFENGAPIRMVGTVRDVTSQRELQEALIKADRHKDEFLAMLAHELRNPVAPILNTAQLLASRLRSDETSAGLISVVERQAKNLARLLDDLLDIARITRDRIELRREVIDVKECVTHALETVEPLLRAGRFQLRTELASSPLWVDADRVRITQCVTNLLSNAAKYSEPGTTITVRSFGDERQAVIEVQDRGRGIEANFLPHVFELFAQGPQPLNRESGGLGIGLSVCKRLMEMHGGAVKAYSEGPGRGSTFTLTLPLSPAGARADEPARPAVGVPRRVLIVDDNRDAADSIALLLQLAGHDTRVVYGGRDALDACAQDAPEVVLLDIGLPGMDGYEVVRSLRASGYRGRAIALSGYGQPEDRRRAIAAGFDAHLVKPVEIEALVAALAQ